MVEEVVFTVRDMKDEDRQAFLDRLRVFLRTDLLAPQITPDIETFRTDDPAPEQAPEDQKSLAAGYNWVLSCRIPPNAEDEY